jgi:hypothetical protein
MFKYGLRAKQSSEEYVLSAACFTIGILKEFILASFAAILLTLCLI